MIKKYENENLNKISFPLGGIGAGSISIAGNGVLKDPEFNNHPDRNRFCGFSGFAVRAEEDGKTVDARLLNGDLKDDYANIDNYFAGFRHFDAVSFEAEFPFAKIRLTDTVFPAEVVMEAYNPFIPSNDKDSSIPAAFFNITVKNTYAKKLKFTVFQNMTNMLESNGANVYSEKNGIKAITLNGENSDKNDTKYASITIATDCEDTSHTDYWYRGRWFDKTTMFKNDLMASGKLKNRIYDEPAEGENKDTATLAASAELEPGESKVFKFLISWFVPNARCYWKEDDKHNYNHLYKNYYSALFESSFDAAEYCFLNWQRLYDETKLFADDVYGSELPDEVKDAISGNIAILKSTTCLRLEDGSFWAWEGVWDKKGSCEGTCQHVYNYAYALAFLFPSLEKGIRSNEMKCCLEESGKMNFRMPINLTVGNRWHACADGQMGFVVKCYREWKLSGDDEWLKKSWPDIKKCLAFAWSEENPHKWDPEKSGVITGRAHHTLDVELFGVYSWLTGMYHAALCAAAEIADWLGEKEAAAEYREILERGKKTLDEKTFNGEYFVQLYNVENKKPIEELTVGNETPYYWDDELKQAKYQIENGCEIDQVLADWHTDLNGLPNVFVREHRKSALEAIYKYNFTDMHDLLNPCRVFACNDEKGVIMCSWPNGVRKPEIPIPYSEECMTGFEYAFAANMLQCGMEDKALNVVREIRRRYDGSRRNPFAEIECGASYGRAMASYSFLLIYSGFKFDMPNKTLGFKPLKNGKYFWSIDGAWGTADLREDKWVFSVDYGRVELLNFVTSAKSVKDVRIKERSVMFEFSKGVVSADMKLKAGDTLEIII